MRAKSMMILDKKKVREAESRLSSSEARVDLSGLLVMSDWQGGIWVASRELADVDLSKLDVASVGMRIAEVSRDGKLKLNKNGVWMFSGRRGA